MKCHGDTWAPSWSLVESPMVGHRSSLREDSQQTGHTDNCQAGMKPLEPQANQPDYLLCMWKSTTTQWPSISFMYWHEWARNKAPKRKQHRNTKSISWGSNAAIYKKCFLKGKYCTNVRHYFTTDNELQPEAPTDLEMRDFKRCNGCGKDLYLQSSNEMIIKNLTGKCR